MKVGGAILMPESAPVALPSKTLLFIGDTHLVRAASAAAALAARARLCAQYWLLPEDVYERHRRSRGAWRANVSVARAQRCGVRAGKCRFVLAEQSELLLQRKRPRAMTHAELAPAACAVVKSALAERCAAVCVRGARRLHASRALPQADALDR